MTTVFLNGRFLGDDDDQSPPLASAQVSVFDAGFQHGVGLFETMTGGTGGTGGAGGDSAEPASPWVLHLDQHLDRLATSARQLGLSATLRTQALAEAVLETARRSGLARARIRLTITGGDLSLLSRARASARQSDASAQPTAADAAQQHDPTILIVAQRATAYPDGMFERGVAVTIADARANPLNPFEGHKTLNYWWRLRELQTAAAKGAAEAIVLSVTNHLCGGCVSNLFLLKDDVLLTPIARGEEGGADAAQRSDDAAASGSGGTGSFLGSAAGAQRKGAYLPSPVLPGITRAWVIDHAERQGIECRREMLSVADLLEADEVFLTNSSWGVLPVVKIEANAVGDAVPGRVAKVLREAWVVEARK